MESGVGNNPYGVEVGGHLASYPTMAAGIQAAANLLLTATQYSSIRSALRGGDPNAIASAITASPWNTSNSAYYAAQFTQAGFTIDLSTVPGSAGASSGAADASPAAQISPLQRLQQIEALLGGVSGIPVAGTSTPAGLSLGEAAVQSATTAGAGIAGGLLTGLGPVLVAGAIIIVALGLGFMGVQRLLPSAA